MVFADRLRDSRDVISPCQSTPREVRLMRGVGEKRIQTHQAIQLRGHVPLSVARDVVPIIYGATLLVHDRLPLIRLMFNTISGGGASDERPDR
jgi:hypothetical protein